MPEKASNKGGSFERQFELLKFFVESDMGTPQQEQSFLKFMIDTYVDEDLGKEVKREWKRYVKTLEEDSDAADVSDEDDWGDEPDEPAKPKSKEELKVIKSVKKK